VAQYNFAKLFDFTALMEIQNKNIEAISEANKLALESFQVVMQRQTELFSEIVKDASSIMQEPAGHADLDLVKKAYEKSATHWHELADIIGKSSKEAGEVIHARVNSSLTEFKSAISKNEKGSAHKKVA
jgi:hypothetical protein